VFKARKGLCPSYIADVLHDYVPSRTMRSSETPTLTVPNLKLKAIGNRSLSSLKPRIRNSLPYSLRAGAIACSDATPGNVTALLRLHLLATQFCCLLSDQTLLLLPFVERVIVRKRANSHQGCEQAINNPPHWPVLGPPPCTINVRKCMYVHSGAKKPRTLQFLEFGLVRALTTFAENHKTPAVRGYAEGILSGRQDSPSNRIFT